MEIDFWHQRYTQQAGWTSAIRSHLYQKCGLRPGQRVLDAGCGTGALHGELLEKYQAALWAVDFDFQALAFAAAKHPGAACSCADVHRLPFANGSFDLTLCHFLLLWVPEAQAALREMRRVTRRGGYLLVLAEPDYGGRIDYPDELREIGRLQTEALRRQGADPLIGRRLHALMQQAGLYDVETGLLGGSWSQPPAQDEVDWEWRVLEQDLKEFVPCDTIKDMRRRDEQAWQAGERILFVPTFYSIGRVDQPAFPSAPQTGRTQQE